MRCHGFRATRARAMRRVIDGTRRASRSACGDVSIGARRSRRYRMRWSWLLLAPALCASACTMVDPTSNATSAAVDRAAVDRAAVDRAALDRAALDRAAVDGTATERKAYPEVVTAAARPTGDAACERINAGSQRMASADARDADGPNLIDRARLDRTVLERASPEGADDDRKS